MVCRAAHPNAIIAAVCNKIAAINVIKLSIAELQQLNYRGSVLPMLVVLRNLVFFAVVGVLLWALVEESRKK